MTEVDEMLSINDAAERLGLHYMTVYKYVRSGKLAGSKRDGSWHVSLADLNSLSDELANILPEYDAEKGANLNSSGMAITQNWLDTAKYLSDADGNFVNRNDAVTNAKIAAGSVGTN